MYSASARVSFSESFAAIGVITGWGRAPLA
jgi:hypothetical protein